MKNHKELFEALLKGETLQHSPVKARTKTIRMNVDGDIIASEIGYPDRYIKDTGFALTCPECWKIKPKTININGFEVPEPCREPLEYGTMYWIPMVTSIGRTLSVCFKYLGGEFDIYRLNQGLIHLTQEAAIAHAEALLSFTKRV